MIIALTQFQSQLSGLAFVSIVALIGACLRLLSDRDDKLSRPTPPPDSSEKAFVRFHAARLRLFRQGGGVIGFAVGFLAGLLRHQFSWPQAFIAMLVGSLLGSVIAERKVWFPEQVETGRASMVARPRTTFLTRRTRAEEIVIGCILLGSGILAMANNLSGHRLFSAAVLASGVAVMMAAQVGERRIAERTFGVERTDVADADLNVRSASCESMAATSAGLVLCCAAWLFTAAYSSPDTTRGAVVVNGAEIFNERHANNVSVEVTAFSNRSVAVVHWTGPDGLRQIRSIDLPDPTPSQFSTFVVQSTESTPTTSAWAFAAVATGLWAFHKWRRAGRIPKEMLDPLLVPA